MNIKKQILKLNLIEFCITQTFEWLREISKLPEINKEIKNELMAQCYKHQNTAILALQ